MKLITRTSYYYFLISVVVSLICGVSFYYYVSTLWNEEINEQMEAERQRILEYVKKFDKLPVTSPFDQHVIGYVLSPHEIKSEIKDTQMLSPLKDEFLPYRQLLFPVITTDHTYSVMLYKPLMEKDDLLQTVAKSLSFFLLSLILLLVVFHQWVFRKLWKPFYQTLTLLRRIELQTRALPEWPKTNISEFRDLQTACDRLLDTIQYQFQHLSEFTGYASHEIQTSLAIIRSKLELIMQNPSLSEQDWQWLNEAFGATDRLSRLTHSLLILSKVDNDRYPLREKIDLGALTKSKMESLKEWEQHHDLTIEKSMEEKVEIMMDPALADILIHNILMNAYKHNIPNGHIRTVLSSDKLSVANTGLPLKHPSASLFKPYIKEAREPGSTGLGLAIVERICQYYGFTVDYRYESERHVLTIYFT